MSTATTTMIETSHLSKRFGEHLVIDDVTLSVKENEVLAIIGPSGCGKSTLLRLISGLEHPDTGTVAVGHDNLTMVFQYSALFDSLTVFDNVAFSLMEPPDDPVSRQWKPPSEAELQAIVKEKLLLLGLDDHVADLYPNELSGGMQKRVSFARAVVSNPKIILYDEPTAGLDPIASTVIENYILKLRDELNAASIVVTHNISTIKRCADRVCLLFGGSIQWEGSSQEFFETDDPFARQFAKASLEGPMTHMA